MHLKTKTAGNSQVSAAFLTKPGTATEDAEQGQEERPEVHGTGIPWHRHPSTPAFPLYGTRSRPPASASLILEMSAHGSPELTVATSPSSVVVSLCVAGGHWL